MPERARGDGSISADVQPGGVPDYLEQLDLSHSHEPVASAVADKKMVIARTPTVSGCEEVSEHARQSRSWSATDKTGADQDVARAEVPRRHQALFKSEHLGLICPERSGRPVSFTQPAARVARGEKT